MIKRKSIDWIKTGKALQLLREHNPKLRRNVCSMLNLSKADCSGECDTCKFEMDNHISRVELAKVFLTSEGVIYNWENGRTAVDYADLLYYSELAECPINEFVIFEEVKNI